MLRRHARRARSLHAAPTDHPLVLDVLPRPALGASTEDLPEQLRTMRKLAHSARNKKGRQHTTPPTVFVKPDSPASSSRPPKEPRGRAHTVDDGLRCTKDLRAARPRTPNECELFLQACSLEDKSKDDRVPTLLFDEIPYEDMCRKEAVSNVRLHARAAARYGGSREAADCAARLLRALWLLDAVPAPWAPRSLAHLNKQ